MVQTFRQPILSRIRPKSLGTKMTAIIAPDEWIDGGGGVFLLCRLLARFVSAFVSPFYYNIIYFRWSYSPRAFWRWHLKKRTKNSYCLRLNGSAVRLNGNDFEIGSNAKPIRTSHMHRHRRLAKISKIIVCLGHTNKCIARPSSEEVSLSLSRMCGVAILYEIPFLNEIVFEKQNKMCDNRRLSLWRLRLYAL